MATTPPSPASHLPGSVIVVVMWRELARFLPSLAFLALPFGGRWLHVTFNLGTIPASILEPEVPARGKPFKGR